MSINDRLVESVVYRRLAPPLLVLALIIAIAAAVGTYVNDRAINQANARSLAAQGRLLGCFDRFATALAGGLPPVRVASAQRDAALAAAAVALQAALVKLAAEAVGPTDVRSVIDALGRFLEASDTLDQVRSQNPYPEAPSQFCAPAASPRPG